MGIRGYLAAISAVLLIPWVALMGFGLDRLQRAELTAARDAVLDTARSIALATDRELAAAEAALRVLANSTQLRGRDFSAFHAQATAARLSDDASILLFDANGRLILTTRYPYGNFPRELPSAQFVVDTLQLGRVEISGLTQAPDSDDLVVIVAIPVVVEKSQYVMVHAMTTQHFQRVFADHELPGDWTVAVFDRHYLTIARSPRAPEWVGKPASEPIRRAAASATAGDIRYAGSEGTEIHDFYTRSPQSEWLVAVGVPAGQLNPLAKRAIAFVALAAVLTLALAGAIVLMLGRGFGEAMARIGAAVDALGRGEPLESHTPSLKEIDALRGRIEDAHQALERESDARARAEAERLQLFENEQAARQAAEQQNHAKDEFLAMLGHERRNPLSAISGAVGLMKLTPAPDDQWAHARDVIGRQTLHLSRVVDDLLDLSRIMTGKVILELAPLDLAQAAANCLDTLRASGRIGEQQVVPKLESAWVNADAVRLEQIIANLLSNAV